MQVPPARRSNRERSDTTRQALLGAARALFVARGYAETATPDIVAAAGVTRGALYHHFEDKAALFRAVVAAEFEAVAADIAAAAPAAMDPVAALKSGGAAFLAAMQAEGRTRLLLLDAPAVLGRAGVDELDEARGGLNELQLGVEAAIAAGRFPVVPARPLALLLSSAFDRAALAVADGEAPATMQTVIEAVIDGLAADRTDPAGTVRL
ncbi:TetR/AcrR family transcriptional regulator [Methylobrevis albus]|uniref:TetR family transcriptional regulator n=1 Tax=Methylobrevis albus TaxID=2793297 RepID=A0A931MZ18_9HYPH|nr:TetR/AcrR family transcriptional regulator [Methylobrevis albus]MBH0238585.1 TetR family transcriptional regulator [Methylobrevis albus]